MQRILIKDILLDNARTDVLIEDNVFASIKSGIPSLPTDRVIDGSDMAILPAFYNLHTHAAMTLLRGFCEDLPLQQWLEKIWAREADLQAEDIYHGTRLAILEMIKSGTVFFADMYWHHNQVLKAASEMGMRADIGVCFMDRLSEREIEAGFEFIKDFSGDKSSRITVSPAPHAIYTCSKELYQQCEDAAQRYDTYLQTHLAETQIEYDNCLKEHGLTPVAYLDSIGVLNCKTIAAHCVHLNDEDYSLFANSQAVAVHNPCSNLKLLSGRFHMDEYRKRNARVGLGTDGCSSNNNLSMIEEMKFAALISRTLYETDTMITANEVFKMATLNGAKAYGINAGEIKEGKLADCMLVDLNNERMTPNYNTVYNLVYSADSSCIDMVICDGKILMQNHHVEGEEEIIERAKYYAKR